MSHGNFRFRNILFDLAGNIVNLLSVIEKIENLSLTGQLTFDHFLDQRAVFLNHIRLHWHTVARRRFQLR